MPMRSQRISWAVLVLAGLATVFYFVVVFFPARRALDGQRAELESQRAYVTAGGDVQRALTVMKAELARTEQYNARWRQGFGRPDRSSDFFGRINAISIASGVQVARFEPAESESLRQLQLSPLQIQCFGQFGEIWQWLWQVENMPAFVWVDDLKISKESATGEDVQFEVKLVTFSENHDVLD